MTVTLSNVGSKKLRGLQFTKHPFTKQKLRVLDEFSPTHPAICPICSQDSVEKISVVESEYRGGVRYHVIQCRECDKSNWFVLLGE